MEDYRSRRERYERLARAKGVRYRHEAVAERTAERLAGRGIKVEKRWAGQIHTLAFVPMISWHARLLRPLRELGPLSHFDYVAHGMDLGALHARAPGALERRRAANEGFVDYAKLMSARKPVDWVFVYANGIEILASTLQRVREIVGAPIVGMCFDDKHSWETSRYGEQRGGQIDIAPHLDLGWTSSHVACDWYLVEGGNPVYMPEGCSEELYWPDGRPQDIDVCFVGARYGFRSSFVAELERHGIRVHVAGPGWPNGAVSDEGMVDLFRRSKVILGHGGVGWSKELRNLKARDFDAPCTGSGVYITSYSSELAEFFEIGREILCFDNEDEAVELIRQILADESRRRSVAALGRARCLREHTWTERFRSVTTLLGLTDPSEG